MTGLWVITFVVVGAGLTIWWQLREVLRELPSFHAARFASGGRVPGGRHRARA